MEPWPETERRLRAAQADITAWSRVELREDIPDVEEALAMLHDLLPRVLAPGAETKWGAQGEGIAMLLAWSFGRLVTAYRLVLEGYLSDAVILLRAAWEAKWLLIAFDVERDQASADTESRLARWLRGDFIDQATTRKMLNTYRPGAMEPLREAYRVLSEFAHPGHVGAVMLQAEPFQEDERTGGHRFALQGIQRPADARRMLVQIWYEVLALAEYTSIAFPYAVEDRETFLQRHKDRMSRCRSVMQEIRA